MHCNYLHLSHGCRLPTSLTLSGEVQLWLNLAPHQSVSSGSWSLLPVFLLWAGQIASIREVSGISFDGPSLTVGALTVWNTQSPNRGEIAICQCTGNGIHLSNLLRRCSNCTDIAVFVIWGELPNWFSWYAIIAADKWATTEGTTGVLLLLSFRGPLTKKTPSKHGCRQYCSIINTGGRLLGVFLVVDADIYRAGEPMANI